MSNVIGLNIMGDRGMSNDNVAAYHQRLQAHTSVIVNNNKLAAMLMAQGTVVIYRHKSDQPNGNDDDAHLRYSPVEFVNKRNLEAPPGAIISLTNEPGTGDISQLNKWTLAAMQHCDTIGRKACILNFATGNPQPHHWEMLRPALEYAVQNNHIIGHHDYFDITVDRSLKYHVGRCLPAVAKFGGKWAITELGCAVGMHPERGWTTALSQEAYSLELFRAAQIYWLHDIPVCVYSYGPWHNFGIENAELLKSRLAEYNARMPISATANAITSAWVYVRSKRSPVAASIKLLNPNTRITVNWVAENGDYYSTGNTPRNDWYKVISPYDGYIAGAYIQRI